jgi:hypothetical protein
MIKLGEGKNYPYRSMLTNDEARELLKTDKFTESE